MNEVSYEFNKTVTIRYDQFTEFTVEGNLEFWHGIPCDFIVTGVSVASLNSVHNFCVMDLKPNTIGFIYLSGLAYKKLVELPLIPGGK
jgi:hypothetical protein